MSLKTEHVQSIVKTQIVIWLLAILFASGYALFAKLIWTAKFPILVFMPMMMIGFLFSSINSIRAGLADHVDADP